MLTNSLALASVSGTVWGWIVWIVIGGVAGWLASVLIKGSGLGLLGDILVGIIGGFVGGIILGILGGGGTGIFWTFVTALAGAIVLLLIVRLVAGGTRARV
ncbi:MAG: GlsB/YeaQ/YmgE family stress response membrane protein [Ktedonobacterales bacterium]|nr:GlsB/YeaQ/YmgE family stress response membrane protein [Ktedonobacterales bacterium]